jgi:putative oxidoreductase
MGTAYVFPQLAPLYAALGPWVEALLRVVIALCLIPHGLRIYFGWFRNTGMPLDSLKGLAGALDAQGYRPGQLWAPIIIITELILAPMLALGLFTRVVSIPIFILLALSVVAHVRDGWFWNTLGVEYPLIWAAVSLYFLVNGGGAISLDRMIGWQY